MLYSVLLATYGDLWLSLGIEGNAWRFEAYEPGKQPRFSPWASTGRALTQNQIQSKAREVLRYYEVLYGKH